MRAKRVTVDELTNGFLEQRKGSIEKTQSHISTSSSMQKCRLYKIPFGRGKQRESKK